MLSELLGTPGRRFLCWVTVLGLMAPAAPVFGAADEMVVTARKREESLQEVPLSISALSSEQLRERGIQNNYDLSYFTPNFNTVKQVGRRLDRPVIRGMAAPSTRGEPNASYFIDGVYVSHRSSISTATLEVMERTEIIRGPQSSQFGRATFSGAVNYITRKPRDEFEAQVNAKGGANDDYKLGGWMSGPIIKEKLLYLVSANYESYGGQWHNALEEDAAYPGLGFFIDPPQQGDSSRLGDEQTQDFLGKLSWLPFEGTQFNVKYSFADADDGHWPSLVASELNCWLPPDDLVPLGPGQPPPPGEPAWWRTTTGAFCGEFDATGKENRINLPDFKTGVQANTPPGQDSADYFAEPIKPGTRRETSRLLGEWVQDLWGWQATARGSYSEDELEQAFDLDHQEVRALFGLFSFYQQTKLRDWSAEFRVASSGERKIRTQFGAYYYDRTFKTRQRSFPGIGTVLGGTPPDFANWEFRDLDNVAVFGQLDWDLTERLTLSLEARWGEDTKSVIPSNNDCPSVESSFDNVTPRITVRWQATDDINAYVLAAKGNKPGDFNTEYFRPEVSCATQAMVVSNGDAIVDEEEQWTYEIGVKTSWLENRVTANLAAFYIDWENQGVFNTVSIPFEDGTMVPTTVVRNTGKSEVIGFEIESNFVVTDNFNVIANYGYTDGQFKEGIDDFLLNNTGNGDLNGNDIPSTPKHQIVLGGVVRQNVSPESQAFLRADFVYESERWAQAANFGKIGDRQLVNLRLGVESDRWTVGGYVTNLLNDNTPLAMLNFVNFNDGLNGTDGVLLSNGNTAELWSLNPQREREWGIELQYRVGGR